MNDFNVYFSKSLDHGVTWSPEVPVYGKVAWSDKPWLATSADGQDVFVAFNGPQNGDGYVAVSHDAGATWTQVKVSEGVRYYFAGGGYAAPDGTVTFSQASLTYTAPGGAAEGPVLIHAITSTDGGVSWTDTVVDSLELGVPCSSAGCYADYYDGAAALGGDGDGDLVLVYVGATTAGGPRSIFARLSTDGGLTWSSRVEISASGANAGFPAAVGTANDQVRVWFMDQRTGRWNVWYRTSTNLGASWSTAVRISDAASGAPYKNADGFVEAYGDYGEIGITSAGKTVAIWGEGASYNGPGGVWFNRQK